jgi:transposase InsO family protein
MDKKKANEIATFRYQLIAGVVNRATPMAVGEISAYFKEVSQKEWTLPTGDKRTISVRSLERYKQSYEQEGFEGLKPKEIAKRGTKAISPEILEKAKNLRLERADRSVEQIIFMLEGNNCVEKGKICTSTLARYFRREGLIRKQMPSERNQEYGFRRFEADKPHRLWQADFHHTLYLPDPNDPKKKRKAKLCAAIDDYSRYLVHGQYYWDETMPCLEDTLKKAIEKHGIPEQFYCDNGSAFSSKHLSNICARLGVRLSHSKPYRPQGRGKIERVFQFVDSSFKPEAYESIERGKIKTLEELNKAFGQWVDGFYHLRKHGSTGEPPVNRLAKHPTNPLIHGREELRRFFFLEEERKADKTGCISLNGKNFEVALEMAGKKVQVRYDPFDITDAEIYLEGIFVGKARILDAVENFRENNIRTSVKKIKVSEEEMEGQVKLSMLEIAAQHREKSWEEELSFSGGGK